MLAVYRQLSLQLASTFGKSARDKKEQHFCYNGKNKPESKNEPLKARIHQLNRLKNKTRPESVRYTLPLKRSKKDEKAGVCCQLALLLILTMQTILTGKSC